MRDLVEYQFGADNCEVITDAFAFGHVPFQKADDRSSTTQMCGEFGACDPDEIVCYRIGVVGDHNASVLPRDPIQIRNGSLHVEGTPVRSDRFADRATPVVDS